MLAVHDAGEHGEHGINLHAAHEHIGRENGLQGRRFRIIVPHGADTAQRRAHVGERGHRARESMAVGVSDEHAGDGGEGDQKQEHREIQDLGIDFFVVHDAAAHPDLEDGGGIEGLLDLHVDGLEQDHHTVHLDTAGGGSGAAADKAHQHQHETRQHGPGGIVTDGEAGGGRIADGVEGAVQERPPPGGIHALQFQGQGGNDGNHHQSGHVEAQDRVFQRTQGTADNGHVDDAEVDGRQEHEHDGDNRDGRGIERADTEGAGGEAARGAHAERMADGVENRHAGQQIAHESRRADAQVHPGEDENRPVGTAAIVVPGKAGKFHIGEPEAHGRRRGNDQQEEHHDTQAADKVRGSAPEKQAPRQGLDVFEDGGAGGGEAGNAFEPGVHHGERAAPHGIRQGAEHKGQQP